MIDSGVQTVSASPEWLPHTFETDGKRLTFVHVPRDARDKLMFLAEEHYKGAYTKVTHLAQDVGAALDRTPAAPIHFIFHTAFCCSTLMVKALDVPGKSVGIKEPDVLINLANRIIRSDDPENRQRLALVLRLLARPFQMGETIVVKPTNVANRLALPVLEANQSSRAILLYSDLATLLRSLVKRGMWGRIWGRQTYRNFHRWSPLELGYSAEEFFDLTDLQVAGLAWLMQIRHFNEVAQTLGPSRVMVVDSADFTAETERLLGEVVEFLELNFDDQTIRSIASGPVFSRHSKFSQLDYSVDARDQEHSSLTAAHGEEIELVTKWINAVAAHLRVPVRPKMSVEA